MGEHVMRNLTTAFRTVTVSRKRALRSSVARLLS
jgi:hypothetical protein